MLNKLLTHHGRMIFLYNDNQSLLNFLLVLNTSAVLNVAAVNVSSANCDVEDELPVPTSKPATSSM